MIAVWGDGVLAHDTCLCIPTLYHHSWFPDETTASPTGGLWQGQAHFKNRKILQNTVKLWHAV